MELIWSIWGRGGCGICRPRSGCFRSAGCESGDLRAAVTSFIGRESEVAEMQAVLRGHRLVALTGVGGVGKTRLAIEVAARLAG